MSLGEHRNVTRPWKVINHLLLEYSFKRFWVEVMALSTERRLTLLLMLEAVPASSVNILETSETWPPGGIMREIIEVPLLFGKKEGHIFGEFEIRSANINTTTNPPHKEALSYPRAACKPLMSFLIFQISMF